MSIIGYYSTLEEDAAVMRDTTSAIRITNWLFPLEGIAALGFIVNLAALALREVSYGGTFPRPLELVYLASLLLMAAGLLASTFARAALRRQHTAVIEDERSDSVLRQAARVSLSAVLLLQVPFIMGVSVSAKALALFTVTTGVAAFYIVRIWLDRGA